MRDVARTSSVILALALPLAVPWLATPCRGQTADSFEPDKETKARLQPVVAGILAAFETHDVVCLGEGHGRKNDSDLRIAVVEHPDFVRKVDVIMVECASVDQQSVLDRFIVDGEEMSREELSVVWRTAHGAEVWEAPIYEQFLRTVHTANLRVPKDERVRVLGGDDPKEPNRGKFIRDAVSREILSKELKGLAIYGSGHCQCRGMGFPGELAGQYPGRIWAVFGFHDVDEGRRVFGLGDEPELIRITGTDKEKIPATKLFFFGGRKNDTATLKLMANEIVYYGNMKDSVVPSPEKSY